MELYGHHYIHTAKLSSFNVFSNSLLCEKWNFKLLETFDFLFKLDWCRPICFISSVLLVSCSDVAVFAIRIQEHIQFELAVMHGWLSSARQDSRIPRTHVPSRSSLWSASSNHLLIPPVRYTTVSASAFPVFPGGSFKQFACWHFVYQQSASLLPSKSQTCL